MHEITLIEILDRLVYAISHEVNYYSQFNQSEPLIQEDYLKIRKVLEGYER